MSAAKPHVLFAFSQQVWDGYADPAEISDWSALQAGSGRHARAAAAAPSPRRRRSESRAAVIDQIGAADALVVCHGAPYIDGAILDATPPAFSRRIGGRPLCWTHGSGSGLETPHPHGGCDQRFFLSGSRMGIGA
ncbi:MAG: hypothetical protein R2911_38710 [Caldilineaceae bacterium]